MKAQKLTAALAAAALVTMAGAASAAENSSAMSKSSEPSETHVMAKPELSLTTSQQKLAWRDIARNSTAQTAPSGFTPQVGATVPTQLAVKPVPVKLRRDVAALKLCDYARLKSEVLIVNPSNKKVVDVINRDA